MTRTGEKLGKSSHFSKKDAVSCQIGMDIAAVSGISKHVVKNEVMDYGFNDVVEKSAQGGMASFEQMGDVLND